MLFHCDYAETTIIIIIIIINQLKNIEEFKFSQDTCNLNSKSCKNLASSLQVVCIPFQDCLQDSCKILNFSITRGISIFEANSTDSGKLVLSFSSHFSHSKASKSRLLLIAKFALDHYYPKIRSRKRVRILNDHFERSKSEEPNLIYANLYAFLDILRISEISKLFFKFYCTSANISYNLFLDPRVRHIFLDIKILPTN